MNELYAPPKPNKTAFAPEHVKLVRKIAAHLASRLPKHIAFDELVSAGNLGLAQALDRYEPGRAASFETFAGTRVRGAILDYLRSEDLLPKAARAESKKIQSAIAKLRGASGREPSDEEIAQACDMSLDDYYTALALDHDARILSVEDLGIENPAEIFADADDLSDPHHRAIALESAAALERYIAELPEKEKLVLSLYHEQDMNMKEIGLALSLTEARICQIYKSAQNRIVSRFQKHLRGEEK